MQQFSKSMELSFSNFIREHAFYPIFPFIQYYSPKIFSTYHINNNLEESTVQLPQSPVASTHHEEVKRERLESLAESYSGSEQELRQGRRTKTKLKANRRKSNDEYRPYERHGKRKSNFLKENRNVLPIKIRQMLSFLTRERKSHEIIEKVVTLSNLKSTFNEKRFFAFLKMKKQKVGNYVTLNILKNFLGVQPQKSELYSVDQQLQYLKIIRVMFGYYLKNVSVLCSLTSNRIQSEQKIEHVRVQRQLLEFLHDGLEY